MAANKTCLSAGEIIRLLLTTDPEVSQRVNKVLPIITDTAALPYIVYRRGSLVASPTKWGVPADTATIEVVCYTKSYTEGVELAEAVRAALDGVQYSDGTYTMRSCRLEDSEESWADDAFIQQLVFTIKI